VSRCRRTEPRLIAVETLALFKELELVPLKRRSSAAFKARAQELHERLDLVWEHRYMSASVLDRVLKTWDRPHEGTYDERHKAYAVRERLLVLAGLSEPQPEKAKPTRRRATKELA
jgi:hypothetical protein